MHNPSPNGSSATELNTGAKSSHSRSRITNGALLNGVDGRSTWARRLRDLIDLHVADLGGEANCSAAERSIIRRSATLTVELERLEAVFALAGEATGEQIDLYQRTANSLRRLLESVGLERRARDVTPTLAEYLQQKAAEGATEPPCASEATADAGNPASRVPESPDASEGQFVE